MKIKAKFKGTNSLGYENGENYWLEFNVIGGKIVIWLSADKQYEQVCKYDSLKLFLNNWQILS